MSDNNSIINLVRDAKNKVDIEINQLDLDLKNRYNDFSEQEKLLLEKIKDQSVQITQSLESTLNNLVINHNEKNSSVLNNLREVLENELGSFGEYSTSLIGEEEDKLVNISESSLTNVKDITNSHFESLNDLIMKLNTVANDTVEKPITLTKTSNENVKTSLTEALTFQRDELTKSITTLQEEYREKIGTQMEKVFMGVTMTKEGINGIIKDTLSRLEENLLRLTEGLDENFTSEVGAAQDLFHSYEGKMLSAIELMNTNYESQMSSILEKHANETNKSLNNLQSALVEQKDKILSEIGTLSEQQKSLVQGAVVQLEEEVSKSKSSVIEFMGSLKDQLQNALRENRESTNNFILEITENNTKLVTNLNESIYASTKESREIMKSNLDEHKKLIETETKDARSDINEQVSSTKKVLKEFDKALKQEEK